MLLAPSKSIRVVRTRYPAFPASSASILFLVLLSIFPTRAEAQSTGALQGFVQDSTGSNVHGANVTAKKIDTGLIRTSTADSEGFFQIIALPVGAYRVEIAHRGFRTHVVESALVEVGKASALEIRLEVGEMSELVVVHFDSTLVETSSVSVGQVINERTVQEIPLNGRYFIDLGLLAPGSVTPPQNGFLSPPTRGGGSLAMNTAGNREDTVNFLINGITLNDQVNNLLNFNPPLTSIREFKIDNSTFSAEYGRNSGAIVNVATRSGTKDFHGELYEYFRNEALDARNFFNFTSSEPPPFKRNQFGFALSGPLMLPRFGEGVPPVWSGKKGTFFFFNYESLQQRQGVDLNSIVLSEAQRSSVTDPVIRQLLDFIPHPNITDSSGISRFVGSGLALADVDQFSVDLSHSFGKNDLLHGYYVYQDANRTEPTLQGTTLPGFGDIRLGVRQIFTLEETHVFNEDVINSVRFGFNQIAFTAKSAFEIDPSTLGINIGVNRPIGLPQLNVAGGFNFGGPSRLPQERTDTTFVFAYTIDYQRGPHSIKAGAEYRTFFNDNYNSDTGSVNFPSVAAFLLGNANSFSITLGTLSDKIKQTAVGFFVKDNYRFKRNFTFELGVRYDINFAPTEQDDRFIVFDPSTVSLLRVGRDIDSPYGTTFSNIQPRLGFAWDPFGNGKTSVRAAYAIMVEQPLTNAVFNTSFNPPLATPLTFTGSIRLDNAINIATAAGLAPVTVDHNYQDSNVQSWNLNVQHEVIRDLMVMLGYFGSKGTHLRMTRNINQPINGVRPYVRLSDASPELPNTPLGNIIQVESNGNSSYNAMWLAVTKRFSQGLQIDASYTLSKSLDYNSLSSPPQVVTFQDSYNVRNDHGLSDFDARHRFVFSLIYQLPFKGNRFAEGWQIGAIAQSQTGNPVNIVTSNATLNGVANTVRPDVIAPIQMTRTVDQWFNPTSFAAVNRFGNLGRNVLIGPGFANLDMSVLKNTRLNERFTAQFRFEVFDVFNNANFGQPGRIVGSSGISRITNTRFPTGDSGSSRQLQFAAKLIF
jgi:outer membrane receptor protein involved in Fe transport